jgi:hypothetical protein
MSLLAIWATFGLFFWCGLWLHGRYVRRFSPSPEDELPIDYDPFDDAMAEDSDPSVPIRPPMAAQVDLSEAGYDTIRSHPVADCASEAVTIPDLQLR